MLEGALRAAPLLAPRTEVRGARSESEVSVSRRQSPDTSESQSDAQHPCHMCMWETELESPHALAPPDACIKRTVGTEEGLGALELSTFAMLAVLWRGREVDESQRDRHAAPSCRRDLDSVLMFHRVNWRSLDSYHSSTLRLKRYLVV